MNEDRPLFFFAGLWTPRRGVRRVKDGPGDHELYGFLTTKPNALIAPDVVIEIGKLLESLSDVSQKQALCLAVAAWVGTADPARAFELSEHMRGEVDAYMIRLFGLKKPN